MPTGSLEDRVALLERTLNARLRLQADLQQQVDSLQGEVSELRGQLEQQTYQMEQSQERQRQLYQELDKVSSQQQAAAPAAAAPAAATAANPAPAVNYSTNQDENQAYDAAVNMVLKEKNYDKAIPAFQGFIKQYPSSSYVPNAHYWLGQLLFNKGDRAGAAARFLYRRQQVQQVAQARRCPAEAGDAVTAGWQEGRGESVLRAGDQGLPQHLSGTAGEAEPEQAVTLLYVTVFVTVL